MYDAIAFDEYLDNYQCIMNEEPFKHGSKKGKVLDRKSFFSDGNDYEVLLRKDIPSKYNKYFLNSSPLPRKSTNTSFSSSDNGHYDHDIEFGRSSKLNLSPTKKHNENGIKDSQLLFKKDQNNENIDLNLHDNFQKSSKESFIDEDGGYDSDDTMNILNSSGTSVNQNLNKMENSYHMDLDTGLVDKFSQSRQHGFAKKRDILQKTNIDIDIGKEVDGLEEIDEIDRLCNKTFHNLNNTSLVDGEGKEVNIMIQGLIEKLKDLNTENESLKSNLQDTKSIIKDLNNLTNKYKLKLKKYYLENKRLKVQPIQGLQTGRYNDISDIDALDREIEKLQLKRKSLYDQDKRSGKPQSQKSTEIDLTKLSDNIVQKLISQLSTHKINHLVEKNVDENENLHSIEKHERGSKADQHLDCPFCNEDTSSDLFSNFNLKSENNINQDDFIKKLAEELQLKMKADENKCEKKKNVPNLW